MAERSSSLPVISIVTPSFNQGRFIEETITSILGQDYPRLHYIVIDGGSDDNTVEIIKKYADRIDFWISEKDRGQSHAINKGLAHCKGDIFNWINSDDLLMPGALWTVAEAWMQKPGNIIAGLDVIFDESGIVGRTGARNQTLRNFVRFWEAEDFDWGQIGTFVPLKDVHAIGGVREDLIYCMDYYMMVQLLARGLEVSYLNHTLARFRYHSASKTVGAREDFSLERVTALRSIKDLPIKVADWEWDVQQAKRLVDVARHVWESGAHRRALQLLGRAVATSPRGTWAEVRRRAGRKLNRQGNKI